ncbi:MAG: helix-turn-helix transcriptional regulator, partial [Candidatus Competibacteraceae bacterium]|nr:helix-turn-helix transcriptional regulator [Candidatus Competibacteraceae bacterium]
AQLRAARAFCDDMSQQELAEFSGLSVQSIRNFEQGRTALHPNSIEKLINCLNKKHIIITEDGIRLNDNPVYQGPADFRLFFDDVYLTASTQGGDICLFNGVPSLLVKWLGAEWYEQHAKRMEAIKENFDFKVIIEKEDQQFIGASFAKYRWFPKEKFDDLTIYIYGDKVAFLYFEQDSVTVEVKRDAKSVRSFRVLFDIAWEHVAKEIEE